MELGTEFKYANTLILLGLNGHLARKPNSDISDLLEELAASYRTMVQQEAENFRRRTNGDFESGCKVEPRLSGSVLDPAKYEDVAISRDTQARIIHPLKPEVLGLLNMELTPADNSTLAQSVQDPDQSHNLELRGGDLCEGAESLDATFAAEATPQEFVAKSVDSSRQYRQREKRKIGPGYHEFLSGVHIMALNELLLKGDVLHEFYSTFVVGLDARVVVKITHSREHCLDEATNLDYLHAQNLEHGFPAPKCLGAITAGKRFYLFMTRARGQPLQVVWPALTDIAKRSVRDQLYSHFRDLRDWDYESEEDEHPYRESSNEPPVGSFRSGICKDVRRLDRTSSSPVRNMEDFINFLFTHPTSWIQPTGRIKMLRDSMMEARYGYQMVMTHGDLHPRNIMVTWDVDEEDRIAQTSVKVSSIVDWELAGWYPEYWEYVKALQYANLGGELKDWIRYLPTEALTRGAGCYRREDYMPEYAIDCMLDRWLC